MTQARRSDYQPSIQNPRIKRPTFIRKQLQLCSTSLNNLAELYDGLRLTGALVERRELPAGARERFFEAVARSASTRPKEATAKVASIASAVERRNGGADVPVRAAIPPMVPGPAMASSQGKKPVVKRSLLPVSHLTPEMPCRTANSKSTFKTAVVATTNAVAARIAGIF